MFYKVKNVEPLDKFVLKVTFLNDEVKYYDVKQLFDKYLDFKDLENGLF